jgi:DNA mismatch repair protein MutL
MGRIKLLDTATSNSIAAGEVVERPASVVKELIENSLDAGASTITIEIVDGGIRLIRVTDDGCGMDYSDAVKSFDCHATSKLTSLDDLYSLRTMGFRGEALSSISAVSKVSLTTREPSAEYGTRIEVDAGKLILAEKYYGAEGTTIEVKDLFYNQPARYKFLKKDSTEAQYIIILCERFALIRPDISIRLIKNKKEILHSPGNNDSQSSLFCVYGSEVVNNSILINADIGKVHVSGFAGKPTIARSSRGEQTIFVNERLIRSKTITSAIDEAYKTMLMKGKYAFVVLKIDLPSGLIDVNVHPQKAEVRFWSDSDVFRAVYHALHGALMSETMMTSFHNEKSNSSEIKDISRSDKTISELDNGSTLRTTTSKEKIESVSYIPEKTYYSLAGNLMNMMSELPDPNTNKKSDDENHSVPINKNGAEELAGARYIGIVFATYIMLETQANLILLDQHAAHEKILFEKLLFERENRKSSSIYSQDLLSPIILTLSRSDADMIMESREKFKQLGFDYDMIGDREIALRCVPAFLDSSKAKSMLQNLIEIISSELPKTDDALLLALSTAACKAAVKAHDRLNEIEVKKLIEDLVILENPFHCPHGRPIIVSYSKKDLEKEFRRII